MKKFAVILALILALCISVTAFGADISVKLNGVEIDTRDANGNVVVPFAQDGTTYVPVRAIANALNLNIDWDGGTLTVFIGDRGSAQPELGEKINIYINGKKFIPRDANGTEVAPIAKDGTTYLPVRAVAQAFGKKVDWDGETSSVLIKDASTVDTTKTYRILAYGTENAITPDRDSSGGGLFTEAFTGKQSQIWKFEPVSGEDGFYQIINLQSGCAMDVNGQSRNPGATILQYNKGDGDNQKFMLVQAADGSYKIYSKNSMLPFETSAGQLRQAADRASTVQNWIIEEAAAIPQAEETVTYRKIVVKGTNNALTYATDAMTLSATDYTGAETQHWTLDPTAAGNYAINTMSNGKSMDVANNSTTAGDPIITYKSSGDNNQRWTLEKQENGGYKIRSVSSELYLAVNEDNEAVQTADGSVFEIVDAQ